MAGDQARQYLSSLARVKIIPPPAHNAVHSARLYPAGDHPGYFLFGADLRYALLLSPIGVILVSPPPQTLYSAPLTDFRAWLTSITPTSPSILFQYS